MADAQKERDDAVQAKADAEMAAADAKKAAEDAAAAQKTAEGNLAAANKRADDAEAEVTRLRAMIEDEETDQTEDQDASGARDARHGNVIAAAWITVTAMPTAQTPTVKYDAGRVKVDR